MKILVLSWRDTRNPKAGGAEVLTHELARRWAASGHEVILFTAAFPGGLPEEVIDGVHVIRRGRFWSVHFHAWRYYRSLPDHSFDVVIDHLHGIPFLAPLYVQEPKVLFACEVAREIWFKMYPLPVALVGYLLEPLLLQCYRRLPFFTISESTRSDLVRLGLSTELGHVIPVGVSSRLTDSVPEKTVEPTILFVGRLCRMKRVLHIIRAFAFVQQKVPTAWLWLVGDGDASYVSRLRRAAVRLGVIDRVTFFGYVTHEQKLHLMQRAWVLASASVREGWGLVITEANAMGTPAVVYDVPGYRDSVRHGETGILAKERTPRDLADGLITLLQDHQLRTRLQVQGWRWSQAFDWDLSAQQSLATLEALCSRSFP